MKRILAAAMAAALLAGTAQAADPRLKSVHYEADKVVPVQGRLGYQSMIEFAPGEQIENVAVGDSSSWQVTPNKRANLLFLKPLLGKARTNMTVVTDQRVYLFDLSVASAGNTPMYNLRFTYGAQPKQQSPRIAYPTSLLANASAPPAARTASAGRPANPKINYAWKGKGKKDLLPVRSYDDGRQLYLQWKPGAPMPALFERDEHGREGLLNYRQQGTFIVVDGVPNILVMKNGKREAILINRNPVKPQNLRIAER